MNGFLGMCFYPASRYIYIYTFFFFFHAKFYFHAGTEFVCMLNLAFQRVMHCFIVNSETFICIYVEWYYSVYFRRRIAEEEGSAHLNLRENVFLNLVLVVE